MAERNLEGCYQKRSTRSCSVYVDGWPQANDAGAWADATKTLVAAATKGWMGLGRQLRRYLDQ